MKKENNTLYEKIINSVAKEVKKTLNENSLNSDNLISLEESHFDNGIILGDKLYLIENEKKEGWICGIFDEFSFYPAGAFNNLISVTLRNNNLNFKPKDVILIVKRVDIQKMFSSGFNKFLNRIDHIEILYDENEFINCYLVDGPSEIPLFTYKDTLEKYCETYSNNDKIRFMSLKEFNELK